MDLTAASAHIQNALDQLRETMGEPVFDEWIVVQKDEASWQLVEYHGPREGEFRGTFKEDIASLRNVLDLSDMQAGNFAFSHEGHGPAFDAFMTAGKSVVILFNHTGKSTGDITADPKWKTAQVHFNDLLETFLADPVH